MQQRLIVSPRLEPTRPEARAAQLGVLCAVLVIVGSIACKTYWFYDRDSSASWCGVLALGAPVGGLATLFMWVAAVKLDLPLYDAYYRHRLLGRVCAGLGMIVLAVASGFAASDWRQFSEEMRQPRDYEMAISLGLPIVTVAGAFGALLALTALLLAIESDREARAGAASEPRPVT